MKSNLNNCLFLVSLIFIIIFVNIHSVMGVSPSKQFGEEAKKIIEKRDVFISASSPKELATFAAG